MGEFLRTSSAQLVAWLGALAALIACGIYLIGRIRNQITERHFTTSELITNFRELHAKGELTDTEYRTIKGRLSKELQEQLLLDELDEK